MEKRAKPKIREVSSYSNLSFRRGISLSSSMKPMLILEPMLIPLPAAIADRCTAVA